jgi:hypothetical protein
VLRWTGDATQVFTFAVVGEIAGDGAELAVHQGRLFVNTWPDTTGLAGLFMSPPIPAGGLTTAQAGAWHKVWQVDAYEPDPVIATTYGGGAMISYGGYLYWGTIHVPLTGAAAFIHAYGRPTTRQAQLAALLGAQRATSVFRARNFDATPQVELLYGERQLPVYQPGTGWQEVPTRAGPPLYGPSGFGNPFNAYTWSMAVFRGQLFVGTMNASYLFPDVVRALGEAVFGPSFAQLPWFPVGYPGAKLYRFPSPYQPAVVESRDGLGDVASYGIRTMLADADALYLGMANPMNLLTTPGKPLGGWQLIEVRSRR